VATANDILPPPDRLRAALRRHGLVRRPRALRRFLRRQQLRFTDGNRLRIFPSGDLGLAAMLAAIERAQRRIHLETYILRDDATGRRFIAALEHQARRGLAVRLLYDAVGSLNLDPRALQGLRAAGAGVVAFNPLGRLYPRWLPRRRDHRKVLVVDGAVAFTGGLNIGDEYNIGPQGPGQPWRDTQVQIEGPAVQDFEAVFLESWFRADGSDLPWSEVLATPAPACGSERVAVVADGPSYRRRIVRDLVALGLRTAREHVRLTSPYFAPDHKILGALAQAGRRGIRVSLLLAGRTDHPVLRRAARSLLPRLLASGVAVYEHQQVMLHAKTSVVDQHWAMAGTSNLDRQSFEHSYEVNLIVEGGVFPTQLAELFDADLAQATRIDAAVLAGRGVLERALDRACALALWVV
jgi:cardiolipin synthase